MLLITVSDATYITIVVTLSVAGPMYICTVSESLNRNHLLSQRNSLIELNVTQQCLFYMTPKHKITELPNNRL